MMQGSCVNNARVKYERGQWVSGLDLRSIETRFLNRPYFFIQWEITYHGGLVADSLYSGQRRIHRNPRGLGRIRLLLETKVCR